MTRSFPTFPALPLALPLALLLAGCGPDAGQGTGVPPPIPNERGHAANVPDAAPSAAGREPAPQLSGTLDAYRWRLDSATTGDGRRIDALFANTDAPLQLEFADGRVVVTNACNRMAGPITLDAASLTIEPMTATEMACDGPLMDMEREANTRLSGRHEVSLEPGDAPRLRLVNGRGDTLVFRGTGVPPGG